MAHHGRAAQSRTARTRAASTRGGTIAVAVGLVVLIATVATLSVLALRQGRPADAGAPRPAPTFTFAERGAGATLPPTPTPSPTPSQAGTPAAPGAAERFLALGGDILWRATAGACDATAPVVERSADAGTTWQTVTPTAQPVAQIRALTAIVPQAVSAVADLGAACELATLRSYTDGQFWEAYPDALALGTYSASDGTVVLGGQSVAAPCGTPWGLRSASDHAALICDGTAYRRDGDAWTALDSDARAIATTADGVVVVARVEAGCPGILLTVHDPAPRDIACIDAPTDGAIALDVADEQATVWVGDQLVAAAL